jgi:hypothetical protein
MTTTQGTQDKEISETQFWENYIRDATSKSISNIEDSGSKVQTGIGLIWTIYTTAAVVGTSLFKPGLPLYMDILIALPIFIMMIGYYFTTRVQVHSVEDIDINNIDLIKFSVDKVMLKKKRLLDIALYLMLATAIVVAVAIGFIATYQSSKIPSMQVSEVIINNQTTVATSGYFPPNTKLDFIVEYNNENGADVVKVDTLTTPASGNVNSSITLADKPTTYTVTAKWTGNDTLIYSLQKLVKP